MAPGCGERDKHEAGSPVSPAARTLRTGATARDSRLSPPGREEGAEGREPRPAHLQQGQSARSSRKGGHCRGRSSAGHTQSSLQARGAHAPSIHRLALAPHFNPPPLLRMRARQPCPHRDSRGVRGGDAQSPRGEPAGTHSAQPREKGEVTPLGLAQGPGSSLPQSPPPLTARGEQGSGRLADQRPDKGGELSRARSHLCWAA